MKEETNVLAEKNLDVLEYMRSISSFDKIEYNGAKISEWTKCWIAHYCHSIKDTTLSAYKTAINYHINRVLGDINLTELSCEDVQLFINSLSIGVGLNEPLSPKYIKNIHGVLHKCLETAVDNKYINENPAKLTILPRCEKHEIRPFTVEELSKFVALLKKHPKRTLFIVAAFTGLRQGELIGLTWDCIDFKEKSIYVYRQLTKNKNRQYVFSSLKSSKPRKIYPAPHIMKLLLEHKQNSRVNSPFVFTDTTGNHYTHSAIYKSFKRVVGKHGYPNMRFHDLRHTYAVLSLQAGDDIKTLQNNMGHHSAAFTLDVYGHCSDDMKKVSAMKMGKFIDEQFDDIKS